MAGDWYTFEEVLSLAAQDRPTLTAGDVQWITEHLNKAFDKGCQIGAGEVEAARLERELENRDDATLPTLLDARL